jgi:DNA-binding MarR family transcriptional regulator
MPFSILRHVPGFTPVIDVVAHDVGITTAAVYGVHWRYCQMEEGVSRAAMKTIGARLGLSAKTVRRHTQKLCERGYLKDLTPDATNTPHVYRDLGRDVIDQLLRARPARSSDQEEAWGDGTSHRDGKNGRAGGTGGPGGRDKVSDEDSSKKEEKEDEEKRNLHPLWFETRRLVRGMMTRSMFRDHYQDARPVALRGNELTVAMASARSVAVTQRLNRLIVDGVEKQNGIRLRFVAPEEEPFGGPDRGAGGSRG